MSRYPETKELEVYVDFAGAAWYCTVSYNPGYVAPKCSNHDDARFSDPGCSPEFSLISAKVSVDEIKFYRLCKKELEELEDNLGEYIEELADKRYWEQSHD